jgi:glutamyl-Q tRNA(Asp) synthetase
MKTRFAPSPTGELHLGHVYAAKVAHDLARQVGGRFLLRQEDIDSSRVREEFYGKFEKDLQWLDLDWDGEVLRQSDRQAAYMTVLESLKEMGLAYPCFCTRKDIQGAQSAPHGPEAAIYPGTCRGLSPQDTARRIAAGEAHSWRFDAGNAAEIHGDLYFEDLRFGKNCVDVAMNGDAVLARKDIGIAYHLAVVVDDGFQEITHVTRGEDLFGATHVQRQLQAILGYRQPIYLHHTLVCDETGKRLAKRDAARSIRHLKESGFSPQEVLAMAQP